MFEYACRIYDGPSAEFLMIALRAMRKLTGCKLVWTGQAVVSISHYLKDLTQQQLTTTSFS